MSKEFVSSETLSRQPASICEREFLEEQQALALLAIRQTAEALKRDLIACANPAVWVRKYPLRCTVAAFSMGFAATRLGDSDDEKNEHESNGRANGKAKAKKPSRTQRLIRITGRLIRAGMV